MLRLKLDQVQAQGTGEERVFTVSVDVYDDVEPAVRLGNFTVQGASREELAAAARDKFDKFKARLNQHESAVAFAAGALADVEGE